MASDDSREIHAAGHQAEQSVRHDVKSETHAAEGGMPQLNTESYAGQLFWLAITFIALYLLISKSALPKIEKALGQRQKRIDEDVDRAEEMTQHADAARAAYEKLHADTRKRVGELVHQAHDANELAAKERYHELDRTLSATLAEAHRRIDAEVVSVSGQIQPVAQAITAQIVSKILNRGIAGQPN